MEGPQSGSGGGEVSATPFAVMLAAGNGTRLLPFTLETPKCLVRVAGRPILDNALEVLAAQGCREVRIVIGHLGEVIRRRISNRFAGMCIAYVENVAYRTTNSMYSLALGLSDLDDAAWVLEGDVFLESAVLDVPTSDEITWLVDSSARSLDGSYVESDEDGTARSVTIVRDPLTLKTSQRKSIGVLHMGRAGTHRLRQWLQRGVEQNRHDAYYDLILADHLHESVVRTVDVAPRRWFEIDTPADLDAATRLFQ
jgi:L-glutamine-phosphate cytidylyltransferase